MQEEPESAEKPRREVSRTLLVQVELAYRKHHLGQTFLDLPEKRYTSINSSETFDKYAEFGRKLLRKVAEDAE
jgi:hypothetical protein